MSTTESKQQTTEERTEEMASMTPELERKGKDAAAAFLKRRGYTIRERDFESAGYQCDIVAQEQDGGPLVFVTVKSHVNGFADEYSPRLLQKQFEAVAPLWLAENPDVCDVSMCCDVIYLNIVSESRAMVKHHVNAIGHVEPTFQEKFLRKASEKTGIDESALADRLTIANV